MSLNFGKIDKNQIKIIHTLKNMLGMDDDTYRAMLAGNYKVDSCKDLSYMQAKSLIIRLSGDAKSVGSWKSSNSVKRVGMATAKQIAMIEGMWKEVSRASNYVDRKKALRSFLERIVGVSDVRFLESLQVKKVVEALKAMVASKRAKAC